MPAQQTKSKPRTRSKPRGGSRSRPRGRSRAKARPRARRSPSRRRLSPRAVEALSGLGLLVVGVLAAPGLWLSGGGPFGRLTEVATKGLVGPIGYVLPLFAAYWGVLLVGGKAHEARRRMVVGFALTMLGAIGVLSIARGDPAPGAGYRAMSDAAGLLGALVGHPMAIVLTPPVAGLVCAILAGVGVMVFTATPVGAIGRALRSGVGWLWAHLRSLLAAGKELRARRPVGEAGAGTDRVRLRLGEDDEVLEIAPPMAGPEADRDPAGGPDQRPLVRARGNGYRLPPLELLRRAPASTADARDAEHTTAALERTFQNFGVPARVVAAHRGPTVTMYEVEVEAGTKVNKVLSLGDDIAYALATPDVRIIAPIPGKSAIGVEVPNKVRDFVMLGDVLASKAAKEVRKPLYVGLGKDVHGRAVLVNLAEMPHVLIAGATGAGKSSLINTFVTSILMRTSPDDVKLVLVDPKRVELSHFADLPHLLAPVIVQPKRAAEALAWVVREMEMRYEAFATVGMRDIEAYNATFDQGALRIPPGQEANFGRVPYILVVIDELADLMMVAPRDVEDAICRIAQMARAVGIHLVVATQRPSVDVVTGLIKANIPSRIAFMTASQADSRVILDVGGAEKLVGHGDMLFQPANVSKAVRIQGAWVTEKEIEGVRAWCTKQRQAEFAANIEGAGRARSEDEDGLGGDDDLLEQAADLVIRSQLGSTSMLQRKLKVGFARAGRLMDLLEERGIVGPSVGSKPRDVLMTYEEWQETRARAT
jgi:DNA segregation ATPase FtsK/SpoIIIE, S-DNA-T family